MDTDTIIETLPRAKRDALRDYGRGIITEACAAEILGTGSPLVHSEHRGPGSRPLALTLRGTMIATMLAAGR